MNGELQFYEEEDIERMFHIGRNKAYALMKSDGFPTIRIGRKIVIPKLQLEQWVEENMGCKISM